MKHCMMHKSIVTNISGFGNYYLLHHILKQFTQTIQPPKTEQFSNEPLSKRALFEVNAQKRVPKEVLLTSLMSTNSRRVLFKEVLFSFLEVEKI